MKVRLLSVLLLLCTVITLFPFAVKGDEPTLPSLDQLGSFAVYNIENSKYIIKYGETGEISPASTVKIMSGLVASELLKGRTEETITLTTNMLNLREGRSFGLEAGQKIKLYDLMAMAFSCGYGDATAAVAVIAGGSVAKFVELMNKRAKELGMNSTVYRNATGIDKDGQKTTLDDTVKLAVAASQNELYLDVSSYFNYKFHFVGNNTEEIAYGQNRTLNKNDVQYYCRSAKGMNAGSTVKGGFCAVTYGEYKNAGYVVVAMGCDNSDRCFTAIIEYLDYAYNNYTYKTLLPAGEAVGEATVEFAEYDTENARLVLSEDLTVYAGNEIDYSTFKYCLMLENDILTAPIKKGDIVGYYAVWDGTKLLSSVPVTVQNDVQDSLLLKVMKAIENYIKGRAFITTVIAFGILAVTVAVIPLIALLIRQRRRVVVKRRSGFKLK